MTRISQLRNTLLVSYGAICCVLLFSGCSSYTTNSPIRSFNINGVKWSHYYVDEYSSHVALVSPHGFLGPVERQDRRMYLVPENGEAISVNDQIYALQRDGTLKHVRCCDSPQNLAMIFDSDGHIVIYFLHKPKEITDCFVYPADHKNFMSLPEEERPYLVAFYGEFDFGSRRFIVRDFAPGSGEIKDDRDQAWYGKATLEEVRRHSYTRRKPFECNSTDVPTTRSMGSPISRPSEQ